MPVIQEELWNAQIVWYLRAFAMNGTEFVDYSASHLGVCVWLLGLRGKARVDGESREKVGPSSSVRVRSLMTASSLCHGSKFKGGETSRRQEPPYIYFLAVPPGPLLCKQSSLWTDTNILVGISSVLALPADNPTLPALVRLGRPATQRPRTCCT